MQRRAETEEEEEVGGLQAKPIGQTITPLVQRQDEGEKEERRVEEEEKTLKPKSNVRETPQLSGKTAARIHSLQVTGQLLTARDRAFFEPRFARNFNNVRIHTDGAAGSHIARDIQARAFTLQNNILFATGEYATGSEKGQRLLANELMHVV